MTLSIDRSLASGDLVRLEADGASRVAFVKWCRTLPDGSVWVHVSWYDPHGVWRSSLVPASVCQAVNGR